MLSNDPFYWVHEDRASDEAFLLLHGLGGGVYEMALLAQELHAQGHSVRAFNYPGHDFPARHMPESRWEDWYAKVEEVYHELAAKHRHVSVIGFSTGCLLALRLAARQPVYRQILLCPFLKVRMAWYYFLPPEVYVRRFARVLRSVPRLGGLPIVDREMQHHAMQACYFKTFNLMAVHSALELIDRVQEELPQIQTPTLIIQARRDSVVCPSGAETILARLGTPHKQLHWLEQSDHIVLLDCDRDQVTRHIRDFIAEYQPQAPGLAS